MSDSMWQRELELLPPDPWQGQSPRQPAGAMAPQTSERVRETQGGRRLGSYNKRADSNADYIARRYGDPLEHLARKAMQSIDELARECGVPRLVAFDFRCAVEKLLARYTEQQPARPVLLAARGDPTGAGALHLAAAQAVAESLRTALPDPVSEMSTLPLTLAHSAGWPLE